MNQLTKYLVAALALTSSAAFADMNVPNPLVRPLPPKLDSIVPGKDGPQQAQASAPPIANQIQNVGMPQQGYMSTITPFKEVKDRLAIFYVSAIVGDRAILRRYNQGLRAGGAQLSNPNPSTQVMNSAYGVVNPMNPNAQNSQLNQNQNPNESLAVRDGENLDFLGDSITLTTKVENNRVIIYFTDDGTGLKKGDRHRQVVFVGQVESSMSAPQPQIVLEKQSATFKQSIDVTPKRSFSTNINGGSSSNGNPPSSNPSMNGSVSQ